MKPHKSAVAFVIYNPERTAILIVRRSPEDTDLPAVWGLPAGSLLPDEIPKEAVVRSAREKLGVEVEVIGLIGEDEIEREDDILHMKEYEVCILVGTPCVPQPVPGVSQYAEWKWGTADDLKAAADAGSLCSRVYLQKLGHPMS